MDAYLLDWLNLLLRWAHLITGIAWIGASFYFIWLDDSLETPKSDADRAKGVAGEVWSVHGGGFYHAQKYRVAPARLPETLHWFKWEAYWTWITGFFLLVLMYYLGAEVYLIDRSVMELTRWQASAIGLGFIAGGWIVYDLLCRSPLGRHDIPLGAVLFLLLAGMAWALTQIFGGRGAFIHYGSVLGTIMVANVAMVIIPGQRELVRAKQAGREPDPRPGLAGKQRSVHNTYFTLPVLFVMISSHYAMTWGHGWNWLVLIGFTASGALIRVWFVLRHRGRAPVWPLAAGLLILAGLGALIAPRGGAAGAAAPAFAEVERVIAAHCVSCHAARPTFPGFAQAPKGVLLDAPEHLLAQALAIQQQTVLAKAMPPGNLTRMSDQERALIDRWFRAGHPGPAP